VSTSFVCAGPAHAAAERGLGQAAPIEAATSATVTGCRELALGTIGQLDRDHFQTPESKRRGLSRAFWIEPLHRRQSHAPREVETRGRLDLLNEGVVRGVITIMPFSPFSFVSSRF
jgi:hypothetical protein